MSPANLTPDTAFALLQAGQNETGKISKSLQDAAKDKNLDKIDKTAKEFEAVFVAEMLKPMFEGLEVNGTFGGGRGEEVFRGMLLQEYGKIISQTGGVGLADHVKDQMIQLQEQANKGGRNE